MKQSLISNDVWSSILTDWGKNPRHIAVSYYSKDDGLTFEENDILVVDASDDAVRSGRTNARALERAVQSGAHVFSQANLHSKVFVLGDRVYVGSANSSENSRERLIECVVSSDDPHLVGEAVQFIAALQETSVRVDRTFLKRILRIDVDKPGVKPGPRPPVAPSPIRCWMVGIFEKDYPGDESKVEALREELGVTAHEQFEKVGASGWFWWPLGVDRPFSHEAKEGDLIVEIYRPDAKSKAPRTISVTRQAVIKHIQPYSEDNTKVFFCDWTPDHYRTSLSWGRFETLLKKAGDNRAPSPDSCRELKRDVSERLLALWPTADEQKERQRRE